MGIVAGPEDALHACVATSELGFMGAQNSINAQGACLLVVSNRQASHDCQHCLLHEVFIQLLLIKCSFAPNL
jgi:hypothetical protein